MYQIRLMYTPQQHAAYSVRCTLTCVLSERRVVAFRIVVANLGAGAAVLSFPGISLARLTLRSVGCVAFVVVEWISAPRSSVGMERVGAARRQVSVFKCKLRKLACGASLPAAPRPSRYVGGSESSVRVLDVSTSVYSQPAPPMENGVYIVWVMCALDLPQQ